MQEKSLIRKEMKVDWPFLTFGWSDNLSVHIHTYRQLRARRALSIFNNVPLRTSRGLSLYKVYGDSALLFLNIVEQHHAMPFCFSTLLNSINAFLFLNIVEQHQCPSVSQHCWTASMPFCFSTLLNSINALLFLNIVEQHQCLSVSQHCWTASMPFCFSTLLNGINALLVLSRRYALLSFSLAGPGATRRGC